MKKRGELTSSQIATLILTIAGFIIALIFLFVFLDTKSMTDAEICRLSILARATAPEALQRLAPLKCNTQKICLSSSGKEDCTKNQFIGEEKNKIIKKKVSSNTDLEKEVANSMLECWQMTGEGKLDVFGGGTDTGIWKLVGANNLFKKKSVCLICSRLAVTGIDEKILKEVDVSRFMETTVHPSFGETYLNILTDRQIRSFPREFRGNLSEDREENKDKKTDQIAIIFMQISPPEGEWQAATETGGKSAALVFTTTTGVGPLGLLTLKAGGILSVLAGTTTGTIAYFQTWRSRDLAAAYCGELTSITSGARDGCSVVISADYNDIAFINRYCGLIEGNP